MRGAAPSTVCPRCELEAPPGDGRFTTCLGCGMSIDATKERQKPVRRARPESEPEPAPAPPKPRKPGALSGLQIVGIVVGIAVFAYVKVEYFPSRRQRETQEELERIQRESRERMERFEQMSRDLKAIPMPSTGVAACDRLTTLVVATCKTAANVSGLQGEIDRAMEQVGSLGAEKGCAAAITTIEEARTRLRCD